MTERSSYAAGFHAIESLLRRKPERVLGLSCSRGSNISRLGEIESRAGELGIAIQRCEDETLDRLAGHANHQGIVARIKPAAELGEKDLPRLIEAAPGPCLVLVLDQVQDPHNLGACLRSAEAAGVDFVLLPRAHSAPLSATVRKVASGAADLVPVVRAGNLSRALDTLKSSGIWVVGTADDAPQTLHETDLGSPTALVMGREGSGLRKLTAESCDLLVSIPMAGTLSSLNVSVATGVCLFEAVRQRNVKTG